MTALPGPAEPDRSGWCPDCCKVLYAHKREAQTALNSMRSRLRIHNRKPKVRGAKTKTIPRRVYACPTGNGWHLTRKIPSEDQYRPERFE